jgi:apolipoprotein N-acyltransferase
MTGLLLTAAFPPGHLAWVAWVALIPLLKAVEGASPSQSLKFGFISGLAHQMTLLYWIVFVLKSYGRLDIFVSTGAYLLLCFYLALYPALFAYAVSRLKKRRFSPILSASVWVGLEWVRAKALTGFPWCLLGYTQFEQLHLIQIADVVGVYGLSFLIVIINVQIYNLLFQRPLEGRKILILETSLVALVLLITLGYGYQHLSRKKENRTSLPPLNTALVQGNVDQSVKWHPDYQKKTLQNYRRLTQSTLTTKPDLIVWPETAVPIFFQDGGDRTKEVVKIAKEAGAQLIFGSPAYGRKGGRLHFFNRAYHLSPRGEVLGYYDKVHLVPFGEYIPLKRFFPFLHRLVQAAGDFVPGKDRPPFSVGTCSAGILICFEVIFPELARLRTVAGSQVLVNLTNDAWFGMSSAPYQHLSMAVFRAVENRRPLVRAANTGISAFIDPEGRIIGQSELFVEKAMTRIITPVNDPKTFYTRFGDIFAYLVLFFCLIRFFCFLYYNR